MKRVLVVLALLLMMGIGSANVLAQDATPAATPSSALLGALGYPTLDISYDGSTVTMPDQLQAGRYLVDFSNTSGAEPDIATFVGATADHPISEILTALQSVDPNQGPPPIYYQVKVSGLSNTNPTSVMTLTAGDWVLLVVGQNGPAMVQFTVSGDVPAYADLTDAVQVDLHEMAIDMPDTIAAGEHIFQVENTGSFPHMFSIAKVTGPITDAQVQNAILLEMGAPNATPVAAGDPGDPNSFVDVLDSGTFSNGLTQMFETNLDPGTYVAFCFVSGPGDVGIHAMQGMVKIFTVS